MAKLTNPQRSNEHQQSFTLNLTLLWTDMDDLMAAVTGFKTKSPPPNAGSPPKKAIVISLESDGDNDDDSELEEVLRSPDWEAKFQAHRGANSMHDFPSTLTHEVTHPRLPWPWSNQKTSALYTTVHKDKWWSKIPPSNDPYMQVYGGRYLSHIGRIMETELGEKRTDNARCTNCKKQNEECWVYSKEGSRQVKNPVRRCTRCLAYYVLQGDRGLGKGERCVSS
ncbi:hypothetical protein E2P81_ATG04864 [Venturia nashicola]|nr:hypothetical protein E2P81_ATG04864 [Venturia nashicola]